MRHRPPRLSLNAQRRLFGLGCLLAALGALYWGFFSDGLPIIWGPTASASEIAQGRELFEHEWTPNDPLAHGDGLGPVFNARSCAACHFQGGLGGGGANEHNVTTFEIHARHNDPTFHTGVVHNFSVDPGQKETEGSLNKLFPKVSGRTIVVGSPGCQTTTVIPDFNPVRTEEVQTTALFGAGWVDLISDRAILRNARNRGIGNVARELQMKFDDIPVGRVRHVAGGVGKFGWKAQFATLREFVAAACANELGLGTPMSEQTKPLTGPERTAAPDLDKKQFRALVSFVKTLPKPVEAEPNEPTKRDAAVRGKELFGTIGCAACHVPDLGGVKGVYSDFLLYSLEDPPPPGGGSSSNYGEPPPQLNLPTRPESEPKPQEWKTPPLWGVADSAPYMHDGSAKTLRDAIQHHGGDAKSVRERYKALSGYDQAALLAFLDTLKAPPDALPLSNPAATKLARK
jgi:mono/diheme cytochrome c family protein